jgi:tetratricopeptide (TPR) repeat protein
MLTVSGWARILFVALLPCLCSAWSGAPQAPAQGLEQKLEQMIERFDKKQQAFEAAMEAAEKAETEEAKTAERAKAGKLRPNNDDLLAARDLAVEAKGTPTALKAWMFVLRIAPQMSNRSVLPQAVEALLADHVTSEELARLPDLLRYSMDAEKAEKGLRRLLEGSPHKKVQAPALFALATMLWENGGEARRPEARKLLDRTLAEFGEVEMYPGKTFGAAAKSYIFESEHLQIGMVAPDFQCTDENGQPFKLSDYRGKVVVVDFWGLW